ncbi:MAG: ribokinase [Caldicoprobacterales bacterium]|jgi:ribokinase|nr:ribokinase [Clostridiales bacterium]
MKKITVVGSLNMDLVVDVKDMPHKGETILADQYEMIPGGKGANQAYAVGMLGGQVTMLGAIGNDDYGKKLCRSLQSAGVCIDHLKVTENLGTGTAIIIVNEQGENSIIVIQGANKAVDTVYIDENMEVIRNSDIIILQLEIPLETVIYTAKKAKELNKMVILDPAPARYDLPDELFKYVDLIKPNETELGILLGDRNAKEDLYGSSEKIKKKGAKNVLVTLGRYGSYLNDLDGNTYRFYSQDVPVVDTTAAGDSFIAAVAVGLAKGWNILSSIKFADKVATVVVTRKGAQSSIPSLQEVKGYLSQE